MTRVHTYLNFAPGNAEEAFEFYRSVFGGVPLVARENGTPTAPSRSAPLRRNDDQRSDGHRHGPPAGPCVPGQQRIRNDEKSHGCAPTGPHASRRDGSRCGDSRGLISLLR